MHKSWQEFIQRDLAKKGERHQLRRLQVLEGNRGRTLTYGGQELLNFAANDYLGLSTDPRLIREGNRAAEQWGSGAGASRLISGTTSLWEELESQLTDWVGCGQALFFNSGYSANTGLLASLADRDTVIFCDRLNHASIYDGVVLSRARLARYKHRDTEHLARLLTQEAQTVRKIIITDAVFSMDGDLAPLSELADLAGRYGALLIVDEAHSLGVFGPQGRGLIAALGLEDKVDIIMGTLGKACGVCGAFIAAAAKLRDYLINNCRPFIFTTALPPFVAGALLESLRIIRSGQRGEQLLAKAAALRMQLEALGFDCGASRSQIIPVILGSNSRALDFMEHLRRAAIFAPAIRPPTVPPGSARVRLSLSCAHSREDERLLLAAAQQWQTRGDG